MNANAKVPKLISRPFLLLRLVVFVLLLLLNVLIISFAAFNITASRTWEDFVGAGPSLAVFNSSVFLFLSMLLIGERRYSHAIPPVSMVLAEACWVGFMTLLTFISSVLSTRLGPARMCSSIPINLVMCSSSILILPVLWMNFFIFFAYSVTLLFVTFLHAPFVPSIWSSTVSEIPWFDFFPSERSDLEGQTVYGDAFRSIHPTPDTKHSVEKQQTLKPPKAPWLSVPRGSFTFSVASFTPAWAKQHNLGLTRGLHNPFSKSQDEGSSNLRPLELPSVLQHPAPLVTKSTLDGRLHERDSDPFAASSNHGTATTKVSDDHDETKSLQPLPGFNNLHRWSIATTSNESYDGHHDTGKPGADKLATRNPIDRTSYTTITTTTAVLHSPSDRRSVSSLFPHDVREEDWNRPLKKPPFRNGRGEGWTTAGATQKATLPNERGGGRRYI